MKSDCNWSQKLASLWVGVPIVDKVGQNDGIPSSSTEHLQAHTELLL